MKFSERILMRLARMSLVACRSQSPPEPFCVSTSRLSISAPIHGAIFSSSVPGRTPIDRKSVVSGKSVSVRVDLGGRRIIKKKEKDEQRSRQQHDRRKRQIKYEPI